MEVSKTRGVETSSRRRKRRQGRRLLARPRWKRHVPVFLEIPALSGGDSRKISLLEVISKNRQLLSSGGRRRKNVIDEPAVHEIQLKFPVSSCFQILLFARLISYIYIHYCRWIPRFPVSWSRSWCATTGFTPMEKIRCDTVVICYSFCVPM